MAQDMNFVMVIGRLTRDVELKYTSGGTAVSKGSVAVNKRVKNGEQWSDKASFFDFTLWGKQAENLAKFLLKGKQIAVAGELEQNTWQKDGQRHSKVEIKADNIQLLGGGTEQNAPSAPRGQPLSAPEEDYGQRDFPEEVPF